MNKTGIIILAAGPSSRLGQPKQLLVYREKTLVGNICAEAGKAGLHPVVVVTGSGAESIKKELENVPAEIVYNSQWPSGMASGIVAGLSSLLALNKNIDAVIIAVCDQPFVSATLFNRLMERKAEQNKGMIGCAYAGTVGTPVLFDKTYFDQLLSLRGDEGAKKLLKTHSSDLASISFDKGNIDIDTPDDYKQLLSTIS
jgi:molybdenum cofactor cytidylyltransferase